MPNSISMTSKINNPKPDHQVINGLFDDGLSIVNSSQKHIPRLPLLVRGTR